MFASLLWIILGLCYCSKESNQSDLGVPRLYGPSEALVKKAADFKCELQTYPKNESIVLYLYKEDNRSKHLAEYTLARNTSFSSMSMVIKRSHEGNLVCVAKAVNNSNIQPTVSNVHYLKVIEPVKGAVIDVRSGPVEFFEGKTLELSCNHTAGTYVSYKWLLNGQLVSPQYHNRLLINRTTSKDSGSYMCMAFNEFNKTKFFNANSSEVVITIKDLVSSPDISSPSPSEFSNASSTVSSPDISSPSPSKFSDASSTMSSPDISSQSPPKFSDASSTVSSPDISSLSLPKFSDDAVIRGKDLVSSLDISSPSPSEFSSASSTVSSLDISSPSPSKFSNASSTEVVITVKDLVSSPDISFTVLKEDSHNYFAMVTCKSTKGTPPVTFSLYNRTELVASITVEDRNATFKVPLVVGKHMGYLQCQANNGDATKYSEQIPIEVVLVEGPVMMDYDYNVGERYDVVSLIIYCKAAKGSFPRYQWFLNKTLLEGRGDFYYVVHQPPQQSILVLSVGWRSAGTYYCNVLDSFDHTSAIRSKRLYLDKHVLNHVPILVAVAVFGCFTVVILVVSLCCCLGVVFRRRHYGQKPLLEMGNMVDAHEAELDLSEYNEDADVLKIAKDAEFDQTSEASVDELSLIEEEKKTLEDEPVEEP